MTDAFDFMSNSIFDNIINNEDDNAINLDDIWKSDLSTYDPLKYPLLPSLEDFFLINNIDMNSADNDVRPPDQPSSEILHHDCMWSGTCLDEEHPSKKKNYRFFASGDGTLESDNVETEVMPDSSLPAMFNLFSQNMQKDPASVFHEIVQSASQNMKYYPQPSTSKANAQFAAPQVYNKIPNYDNQNNFAVPRVQSIAKMTEFKTEPAINMLINIENSTPEPLPVQQNMNYYPQPSTSKFNIKQEYDASQIYGKIPIYNQHNFIAPNSVLSVPNMIKNEPNMKILVENSNVEPITIQRLATIDEKPPVQQVFFYNQEPYFPQVKSDHYEHYNILPQPIYFQYSNSFDDNANNRAGLNNDVHRFQNVKPSINRNMIKQQKPIKKKLQNKRKLTKKANVKNKKPQINDYRMMELSRLRPGPSTSPGSDEDPLEKRVMHNSMERQRRIGLKNLFIELKQAIPTIDEHERVPKVSILHEAISYCRKLRSDEKQLDDLKKKNYRLVAKYNRLCKMVKK